MNRRLVVLSMRGVNRQPAMSCVVELENVALRTFEGQLVELPAMADADVANSIVLFACLSYSHLDIWRRALTSLRDRGAIVVAYVFDAWNARSYFYNATRRFKTRLMPGSGLRGKCDRLVIPFADSMADFAEDDKGILKHVPLGVDSSLVDGFNAERPITVLGYGRQPEPLMQLLSERLNARDSGTILFHTGHFAMGSITDFAAHRRFFWKIAAKSAIALAYDPASTHPNRFPHSIVGQRWFESLAAGCVVVGRRPKTAEADALLGWQDATIEMPDPAGETLEAIQALAADTNRLRDIRERNVTEIRARHDWRHRLEAILADL